MALVRTASGWKDDSQGASLDVPNRWAEGMEEAKAQQTRDQASLTAQTTIRDQEARKAMAATQAGAQTASAQMQADAAVRAAQIKADADLAAARYRARGYAKGGPVIKGEYKHANPTYTKFSRSGDSSLLAKGRK